MTSHDTLSRRPAKEQPPADMCDDKTVTTTADHNNIPQPALAPSIPCPDSDRCDTTGVPVSPVRQSAPAISRFCPTLRMVASRPKCHTSGNCACPIVNVPHMWIRDEDNLLLQTIDNTISLNDFSPFSVDDLLTLRVTFFWEDHKMAVSKEVQTVIRNDSTVVYGSLTHVHRCIGYHNPNWHSLTKSVRLTYLSVYDSRDSSSESTLSPSPPSSLTHVHRCMVISFETTLSPSHPLPH